MLGILHKRQYINNIYIYIYIYIYDIKLYYMQSRYTRKANSLCILPCKNNDKV